MSKPRDCSRFEFRYPITARDLKPFAWEAEGERLRKRPKLKNNPDIARTLEEWKGDYPDAPCTGEQGGTHQPGMYYGEPARQVIVGTLRKWTTLERLRLTVDPIARRELEKKNLVEQQESLSAVPA